MPHSNVHHVHERPSRELPLDRCIEYDQLQLLSPIMFLCTCAYAYCAQMPTGVIERRRIRHLLPVPRQEPGLLWVVLVLNQSNCPLFGSQGAPEAQAQEQCDVSGLWAGAAVQSGPVGGVCRDLWELF